MNILHKSPFPTPVHELLREMSRIGFFERSLLIGSWVMPLYRDLYDVQYILRTMDIDFAVQIAHMRTKMRADLEKIIIAQGFTDYIAVEGWQKFSASGYEVEFITHRPGSKADGVLPVREWNVNAMPLPYISMMIDFSENAEVDGFTVRFPIPEAYFIHKLIIAQKRPQEQKRSKDLDQCAALAGALRDDKLRQIIENQKLSKKTKKLIAASCAEIDFPLHHINIY